MAWTERYVRDDAAGSGDGTTNTNSGANGAWTFAEMITNAAAGHRVNIRAGTYANTTTNRTVNNAGSTTSPIWFRGFNTTPGDLETNPSLTKPVISFTTGRLTWSGGFQLITGLDMQGAATAGSQVVVSGGNTFFARNRVTCTGTNANSGALSVNSGGGVRIVNCTATATSSASQTCFSGVGATWLGNVINGGGDGLVHSSGTSIFAGNIFNDNGASGFRLSATSLAFMIIGNTFYSPANDGIRFDSAPGNGIVISNLFSGCTYGINNNTGGGNIATVALYQNSYYNMASGQISGFGDWPDLFSVTEVSDPLTNAAGGDFSLVSGSLSYAAGLGSYWENLASTLGYGSIGAVQRAASGGIMTHPGMSGRMAG